MIRLTDLNPHSYPTTPEIDKNLDILLSRLNELEGVMARTLVITSGLRSEEQQKSLISQGKSNATHSKHLYGQAADLLDKDGSLKEWFRDNLIEVEKIGFWMEDFAHTIGWVHVQIVPPKSGHRFFIP